MTLKIKLVPILLGIVSSTGFGCTNFLITREATVDNSSMICYTADSHDLYGELYFWESRDYDTADSLDIYEWDTGEYLGKIKQVTHSFQVVGNINENQVAIGETTFTGREELADSLAILDYGSLIYITLQRATSARHAIKIISELVSEYGYYSTGESFSIADPDEVWIMEIIGKGPGHKGAVWVARKIPAGYISGHANQSRIRTFPLNDPKNCLYAPDVISFAIKMGYYSGSTENFSFSDAYAPINFEGARLCEARVWSGFRKVNDDMEQYTDYAMGNNLQHIMPLWVKPNRKLSVKDIYGLMRDYYQNTPMDMTADFGAGAYNCIVRWRPLTWELDGKEYFNERAISTQQTGFSFVAQCRRNYPNPIGGILWFGVDDSYSTVYTPIYCGIKQVPKNFAVGNGSMMDFSDSSAFWIFNQVSNFAYTRYSAMIPYIQSKQMTLEEEYFKIQAETDIVALELYKTYPDKAIQLLTETSGKMASHTFSEWKLLYHFLFTRFMDGNVKSIVTGKDKPAIEQPGYGDNWYRELVKLSGEKFLVPNQKTE